MTAVPQPSAAELLDQLDALRAAAVDGPWLDCLAYDAGRTIASAKGDQIATHVRPADAACIVAEHNAVGQLVAALRGVLALADELAAKCPPDDWGSGGVDDAIQADTGRAFRSTVAAALTDGTPR